MSLSSQPSLKNKKKSTQCIILFTFSIVFTNKNILTKVYLPLIITKVKIPFLYNFISKRVLKYLFHIIFISKRFLKLDGHTEISMCSFFLSFFLLKLDGHFHTEIFSFANLLSKLDPILISWLQRHFFDGRVSAKLMFLSLLTFN